MLGATIFRAEKMITSRLGRFEPHGRVAARHHVLFHAKRRNVKTMNDVFSGHHQLDRATGREVQLVDLPLARGMLNVPHPLFADDINFQRICRKSSAKSSATSSFDTSASPKASNGSRSSSSCP